MNDLEQATRPKIVAPRSRSCRGLSPSVPGDHICSIGAVKSNGGDQQTWLRGLGQLKRSSDVPGEATAAEEFRGMRFHSARTWILTARVPQPLSIIRSCIAFRVNWPPLIVLILPLSMQVFISIHRQYFNIGCYPRYALTWIPPSPHKHTNLTKPQYWRYEASHTRRNQNTYFTSLVLAHPLKSNSSDSCLHFIWHQPHATGFETMTPLR